MHDALRELLESCRASSCPWRARRLRGVAGLRGLLGGHGVSSSAALAQMSSSCSLARFFAVGAACRLPALLALDACGRRRIVLRSRVAASVAARIESGGAAARAAGAGSLVARRLLGDAHEVRERVVERLLDLRPWATPRMLADRRADLGDVPLEERSGASARCSAFSRARRCAPSLRPHSWRASFISRISSS